VGGSLHRKNSWIEKGGFNGGVLVRIVLFQKQDKTNMNFWNLQAPILFFHFQAYRA
jgi:hypothetical protein